MTTREAESMQIAAREIQELVDHYRKILDALGWNHGSGDAVAAKIKRLKAANSEMIGRMKGVLVIGKDETWRELIRDIVAEYGGTVKETPTE
jgi:hypothetical protein